MHECECQLLKEDLTQRLSQLQQRQLTNCTFVAHVRDIEDQRDYSGAMTIPANDTKPVLYPGGETPQIGELFSATMDEFIKNIGPYALAGVGILLVSIPVVIVAFIAGYILMFAGVFGTMFGVTAGLMAVLPRDLEFLGPIGGMLATIVVIFILITLLTSTISALMAPFNASLMRAIAAHQRGEEELTIGAAFSTLTQNIASVIFTAIMITVLSIVLVSFCYIPILLVPLFFAFASGLVAVHGLKAMDAMKGAAGHAKMHLKWHALYMVVFFGTSILANYIPVLGAAFMSALHVRAMRMLFGDGEAPVFATAEALD